MDQSYRIYHEVKTGLSTLDSISPQRLHKWGRLEMLKTTKTRPRKLKKRWCWQPRQFVILKLQFPFFLAEAIGCLQYYNNKNPYKSQVMLP